MGPDVIVPVFGMITGILVMGALSWGLVNIFRGPVGQALAKRIHGGHGDPNPELATELFDLKTQVEGLQQRLAETEERLDFSERLLANRPEPSPPETPR